MGTQWESGSGDLAHMANNIGIVDWGYSPFAHEGVYNGNHLTYMGAGPVMREVKAQVTFDDPRGNISHGVRITAPCDLCGSTVVIPLQSRWPYRSRLKARLRTSPSLTTYRCSPTIDCRCRCSLT